MVEVKSKGAINRLGDKIREDGFKVSEPVLQELQEYRISHKEALSSVFNTLCLLTKKLHPTSITTYRLKRFESIIGKLNRYPKMELSRMWDVAGCRCIVRSDKEVYKLKELIGSVLEIKKEYDYIISPQSEGYKSLHLFVGVPDSNKVIEVQIRNRVDHNWATLVEISDLLFDAKLKEYGENKDLLRFHFLLSKKASDLSTHDKYEIAKTIKKDNYFGKLSEVFTRNYLQVRKQWNNIENNINYKYFLIESRKNEVPKIYPFTNFNEAEVKHFEIYKNTQNANIVLTHLSSPNYENITIAYSNYILTFHTFLHECHSILISLIVEALQKQSYGAFFKMYTLYLELVFNHMDNLVEEMVEIRNYANVSSKKSRRDLKKEKEWSAHILREVKRNSEHSDKLQKLVTLNLPSNNFKKLIFEQMVKIILIRYKRRGNRLLKRVKPMTK
ncbi:MAG: hypothetical protein ABI388_09740 [Bacteroidia bacterium]